MTDAPGEVSPEQADAWIAASVAGDQDAFRKLVEAKRDLVFRVAYQRCGDVDAARSIAQSVFVRLWRGLGQYDRARRFDTWLYQVTVNAAIDHHRRGAARWREQSFDDTFQASSQPAGAGGEADEWARTRETQRILLELADELTERQRSAFLLREVEGMTTSEVAEALGATESTVRNHVFQARQALQRALRERYPEYLAGLVRERP